jgi:hypothetical protein
MDSYYTERVSRISTLKRHALLDERSFRRFVERCHAKSWLKETLKSTSVSLICLAVFWGEEGVKSFYLWVAGILSLCAQWQRPGKSRRRCTEHEIWNAELNFATLITR